MVCPFRGRKRSIKHLKWIKLKGLALIFLVNEMLFLLLKKGEKEDENEEDPKVPGINNLPDEKGNPSKNSMKI